MKCITCTAEIPANWSYALNNNLCPSCGGPIMDEDSKSLLHELRDAMAKMPNDPEGLAGWLLSNYRLTKIGTAEPMDFYKKNSNKNSSFRTNENPVEKLLKRAGVDKQVAKQKKLAALAQHINETELSDDQYGDLEVTDNDEDLSTDNEDFKPLNKVSSAIAKNSASLIDPNINPLDSDSMQEAIQAVASMGSQDPNILNLQRMQRLKRQQELDTMGVVGKIKRAD